MFQEKSSVGPPTSSSLGDQEDMTRQRWVRGHKTSFHKRKVCALYFLHPLSCQTLNKLTVETRWLGVNLCASHTKSTAVPPKNWTENNCPLYFNVLERIYSSFVGMRRCTIIFFVLFSISSLSCHGLGFFLRPIRSLHTGLCKAALQTPFEMYQIWTFGWLLSEDKTGSDKGQSWWSQILQHFRQAFHVLCKLNRNKDGVKVLKYSSTLLVKVWTCRNMFRNIVMAYSNITLPLL